MQRKLSVISLYYVKWTVNELSWWGLQWAACLCDAAQVWGFQCLWVLTLCWRCVVVGILQGYGMYGTGLSLSIERQCYRADLDAEKTRIGERCKGMRKQPNKAQCYVVRTNQGGTWQHGCLGKICGLCLVVIGRHFAAHRVGVRLQSFGPDQVIGQLALGLAQVANIMVAESNREQALCS